MLGAFLEHPFFLNRYRQAPLLRARESFLSHLQKQGTSRKTMRNLSGELLNVVRLLQLNEMREVSLEEIQRGAALGAPATHESQGTFIRQLRVILYICGEKMAATPWATEARKCAADAIRRSTQ
jgi:hypothetical protein